ncbi:MAG: FAD-dependent oxidoreductase [Myxococcaceae bacterium]|nr:FAD-dependent oxidoreductase [Myxococcaceae bacterium]
MNSDVIIIGGGIAGLTTGVALTRAGLTCTVLEAARQLGGRASSVTDAKTGDVIDIGPHIFLTEYPNFFALLDVLGTRGDIVWQERGLFLNLVDGATAYPYRVTPSLPTPLHFMPSLFGDRHISWLDTLSAAPVTAWALKATKDELDRLDDEGALPFLRRMGVRAHHIERYWALAAMSIMNVPLELCSAGALMRLHRRLMGNNDFAVGFAREGLGTLYTEQAANLIGDVRLGARVRALDGRDVVLDTGERLTAKHVIAAVPPHALRALLPRERLGQPRYRKLVRLQPCPYVSVYLWFDRKLTDLQFWARSFDPNDLNLDFYDLANINPRWSGRPSLIASNIIYSHRAHALDDAQVVRETVRELAEFLPEAAGAKLVHSVVHRIPMAVHCPYPGTQSARPKPTGDDGLVIAGDWVDTGLPASMESAARSGWLAAEAVLEAEGRKTQLAIEHPELGGLAAAIERGVDLMPHRVANRVLSGLWASS